MRVAVVVCFYIAAATVVASAVDVNVGFAVANNSNVKNNSNHSSRIKQRVQ